MAYTLPPLPYAYDALEPYIDKMTMELHHDKHHAAYVKNLNTAIEGTDLGNQPVEELIAHLDKVPEKIRKTVQNNGGGHANHSAFWLMMGKGKGGKPAGKLADAIDREIGSFEKLTEHFTSNAMGRFGSGWAWLYLDNKTGKLMVGNTANQDSPWMDGNTPILGIDVWEHAYYLKYQNRRAEYVAAFYNVIDWDRIAENFAAATK